MLIIKHVIMGKKKKEECDVGDKVLAISSNRKYLVVYKDNVEGNPAPTSAIESTDKNEFTPMMETRKQQRDVILITGSPSSGKSTYMANYCKLFKDIYGPPKITIISGDSMEDPAFDGFEVNKLSPDDLMSGEVNLDMLSDIDEETGEYKKCVVIFDDVGALQTKVAKELNRIKELVLMDGRKREINCLISSHISADRGLTARTMCFLNAFVCFPTRSMSRNLRYTLKEHLGLSPSILDMVVRNKVHWGDRWFHVRLTDPTTLIAQKRVQLFIPSETTMRKYKPTTQNI